MSDNGDRSDPRELLHAHMETGEPLDAGEVAVIVGAGLSSWDEWEQRGGGLYWHSPTWPDPDA